MLNQIMNIDSLIFYILAVEVLLLLLAQLRTNALLKRSFRIRAQKKEAVKQMKEEVKSGKSEIPVVKFEKNKPAAAAEKKKEKSGSMDPKEMAVLQEMIAEFFG